QLQRRSARRRRRGGRRCGDGAERPAEALRSQAARSRAGRTRRFPRRGSPPTGGGAGGSHHHPDRQRPGPVRAVARPVAGNLSRREGRALSGAGPGRDEEPIVPAAIEFTPAATEPNGRSPRPLTAMALGLCVLLVLGVIFLLPKLVAPDTAPATDITPPTDTAPAPAEPSPAEPATAVVTPEEPAPDLAARRAAQDALARLQPLRTELVAAAAPRWAPEPF